MKPGAMRELRRESGNSADGTGEERKAAQEDLGNKELQKQRQSRNEGQEPTRGKPRKSRDSRRRKQNASGSREGGTRNTERMNLCAALP